MCRPASSRPIRTEYLASALRTVLLPLRRVSRSSAGRSACGRGAKEEKVRKTIRRATIALALTPVLSIPAGLAATALASASGNGSTTVSTPAPPGDASAVAAEVDGVVSVGKAKAHAGSGGGSADADALSVLGNQISGGSQQGAGSKTGNLIGTG